MKVKALQGDTVDLLCQRYYGTTQGVTETVLAANKGIADQLFLTAGGGWNCRRINTAATKETVQLWN